jgi:biofilm PGA synthesis N-glycosyltransferase PgaC
MTCAVGIMAHDEGANIAAAMRAVLDQVGPHLRDLRLVVVASGCHDDTVPRAESVARQDGRARVLVQPRREGKASAINLFLDEVRGADAIVLAGGDTRPEPGALEALVAPFDDPKVGMTGGRPVPVNSDATWLGRVVRLQWDLHDAVARTHPKLGELVAFRPVIDRLDASTAVDEAYLEAVIRARGLRTVYVGEARVAMKGPTRVGEFIAQRRRIHAGHVQLRSATGHQVSTMGLAGALREALRLRREGRTTATTLAATAILEAWSRFLGGWDARIAKRDHSTWQSIPSTKDLTP